MKYAIVDIVSSSMMLTVYETENNGFKIFLFRPHWVQYPCA